MLRDTEAFGRVYDRADRDQQVNRIHLALERRSRVVISSVSSGEQSCQARTERRKQQAANLLMSELKRKGVTYAQLVEEINTLGSSQKKVSVANSLPRGKFSAVFMLQCLSSLGVTDLRLD